MPKDKIAAEKLLAEYAAVLNAAHTTSIPSFYTEDGVFMPENTKVLTKSDLLNQSPGFLQKFHFQINYLIQDITISGNYSFVRATAQTNTINPANQQQISKTSQDFFVLRKEQSDWKIFRYMFNNVKEL